jgi:hypothetical protein
VQVTEASTILPDTNDHRPNTFQMLQNGYSIHFACNTPLELVTWINALIRANKPKPVITPLIPIKNKSRFMSLLLSGESEKSHLGIKPLP